jgi:hypothetical protein
MRADLIFAPGNYERHTDRWAGSLAIDIAKIAAKEKHASVGVSVIYRYDSVTYFT